MKVISLLQPWASLVVLGLKKIETRSWNTKHRGEILIHASAKKPTDPQLYINLHDIATEAGLPENWHSLQFGAVIGKVDLVDVRPVEELIAGGIGDRKGRSWDLHEPGSYEQEFGDYSHGRFGWLLADAVQFEKPYPAKGQLGIWNFDLAAAINAEHLEFLNSQPGRTNGK